jgi:two-component system, OmpR family, phosphate regulon sensor histidine kinase PhoR
MWSKKLIHQLFLYFLLIMGIPVVFTAGYASYTFNTFYSRQSISELTSRAWLIGSHLEEHFIRASTGNIDSLCKTLSLKVKTRFTVISPTGKVLGDSEKNPDSMENHLYRTEVIAAASGAVGVSNRFSYTLMKNMLYVAVPVYASGRIAAIVRTSVPSLSIAAVMARFFTSVSVAVFFMTLLAAVASFLLSRKISIPIDAMDKGAQRFAAGDFSISLHASGFEETRHLAAALNEMAGKLSETIKRITEQNHELDAILSSMSEGVIAIDSTERILLVNNAAADLLSMDRRFATGKWIGEALRNTEIREFLLRALRAEGPIEMEIVFPLLTSTGESSERNLQLHGSALWDPALKSIGALAVMSDITHLKKT